ncbi:hypothetical protein C8Q75DRAFT_799952 [Abortiporus biennis]|nr:hypothetical protein C8Q75DRAFT_799952 [Abortiporus biennis]
MTKAAHTEERSGADAATASVGAASNRNGRQTIAKDTIAAIERGSYLTYNIRDKVQYTNQHTEYYAPDSLLSTWSTATPPSGTRGKISLVEVSTLVAAKNLLDSLTQSPKPKVGVLNFASAKNAGGGFLGGSRAQEESLARSSTLYPSLTTEIASPYYKTHRRDPRSGLYSHAMVYSPSVTFIRNDEGEWVEPWDADILTSPAVNAGVAQRKPEVGAQVEDVMRERMSRILFLFERKGIRHIVLGSFGTGAFRNDVGMVARIWAELLMEKRGRFQTSFENVVFAILGRETFVKFEKEFSARTDIVT